MASFFKKNFQKVKEKLGSAEATKDDEGFLKLVEAYKEDKNYINLLQEQALSVANGSTDVTRARQHLYAHACAADEKKGESFRVAEALDEQQNLLNIQWKQLISDELKKGVDLCSEIDKLKKQYEDSRLLFDAAKSDSEKKPEDKKKAEETEKAKAVFDEFNAKLTEKYHEVAKFRKDFVSENIPKYYAAEIAFHKKCSEIEFPKPE